MKQPRTALWLGFTIGLLATLLMGILLVIFVPRLRPSIGSDTNTSSTTEPSITTSANIDVREPAPSQRIGNPVVVRGDARTFENNVNIRLKDGDGRVLAESFTTAQAVDIGLFGPFELSLAYDSPRYDTGTLEVFEESARDGSEINKVTIPVRF